MRKIRLRLFPITGMITTMLLAVMLVAVALAAPTSGLESEGQGFSQPYIR